MSDHYYAVIMAGGGGTRLWPLSRQGRPKQMLALVGDRTLFQVTVDRLGNLFPPERILVVTSGAQAGELQEQAPELPAENFILEPVGRNSAPAVGLAAIALHKRDPDAVMAMLTSDHYIENVDAFLQTLRAAEKIAAQGYLVTLGIMPTFPATGFGYIQQGEQLGEFEGLMSYNALRFKEKPDLETARNMLASGDHAWNSGMFIWQVSDVLMEMETQMPELHAALQQIGAAWGSDSHQDTLESAWNTIPEKAATSIDFGVMEGAGKVAVIPAAELGWNDVGSWNALFEVLQPDSNGNIQECEQWININSTGSLVFANGGKQRLVVTIGVEDLVIVDTGDVLLVCKKEQAQDVRQVVQMLKEQQRHEYL